jgi:hypothetical protein
LAQQDQARFRESSASIPAEAKTPTDPIGRRHGHLLAIGYEVANLYPDLRRDGGALTFFSSRGIKWWRSPRSGDAAVNAPTRNLVSSQFLCVNFLLPLAAHPAAVVALLRALDEDVADVVELVYEPPGQHPPVRSHVEFEWVGLNRTLEGGAFMRGAHATSADALLVAALHDGRRRAYLMEWKYTESYPEGHWLGQGNAGDARCARYRARHARDGGCLDPAVPLDELLYEPIYQIARLGLLGDLMVELGTFGVTEARVVVVCPEENHSYRRTITSPALAARFPECAARLWRDPRGVRMTSPAALLDRAFRALGRVRPTRFGFHTLRRKFATDLKHQPIKVVAKLGGWRDLETLLRYQQVTDDEQRATLWTRRARPDAARPGPDGVAV